MNRILLCICFFFCSKIQAQSIYFPKENYQDITTLSGKIPALAKWVADHEKKEVLVQFYDNQIALRTAAGEYSTALNYLDSIRIIIGKQINNPRLVKGFAIDAEIFAKAKMQQGINSGKPFDSLVKMQFHSVFQKLNDSAKSIASTFLAGSDAEEFKVSLNKKLENLKSNDSLNLQEATDIVLGYYSYVLAQPKVIMQQEYKVEEAKTYSIRQELIRMRDGATVQAWVVRKLNNAEKLPAIFDFNIYIDSTNDLLTAKLNADMGYIGVVANTRGKGKSPEDLEPFEHDANDAYDIIDWISKQPWSDGRVGMEGPSYLGFTQWAAAKNLPPALKTIVPMVAVAPGIEFPVSSNIFMAYMLRWIDYVASDKNSVNQERFYNDNFWNGIFKKWYAEGKSFRSLDTLSGRPSKIFQRWLDHPSLDSYWQDMTAYQTDFSKINIPVLSITGYFDDGQLGSMYYYKEHMKYDPHAENYLVIGPYDHGGAGSIAKNNVMGYEIDAVAMNYNGFQLSNQWFNYIFKSAPKPEFLKNKVNFEVMGANEWKHVSSLSEMANDTLTFFLSNAKSGDHFTLNKSADEKTSIRQSIDLTDRSDSSRLVSLLVGVSQAPIISSTINTNNAVTFISQPIDKPIVISGSFIASLKAKINKKDMDIGIALYELMPDGRYFSLGVPFTKNIQRASYANDRIKRELLQPGKKTTIPINKTFITCKKLEKGSRLIVVLGINKNPDLQINYGSGKNVSDETIADAKEPLQIEWFGDSWIKIPVLRY